MTWNSPRSRISPKVKDQVRRRDRHCQLQYPGCTQRIEEMDHVIGLAAQGIPRTPVLSATVLQGVCKHCHAIKTEQQRRDGLDRAKAARGSASKRYRDIEPHPGRLTP
jgi:5-methylcytosine-specific restriction endonuclease McrA